MGGAFVTRAQRYLFDLRGYLVIPAALSASEVDELLAALAALPPEERGEGSAHAHRGFGAAAVNGARSASAGGGMLDWGEPFRRLVGHRSVAAHLGALVGPGFRLDHQYAIFQRPGGAANPLHNGGTPFDPSQYYLVRDGRIYNGLVVVAFALTDVPPGAGGFCCVPGSHKSSFPLPRGLAQLSGPDAIVEQVPLRAGDALIFSEALTHGALPWSADHERRMLLFKYCPGHMRWHGGPEAPSANGSGDDRLERILAPPYAADRPPSTVGAATQAELWVKARARRARARWRRRDPAGYIDTRN